MGFETKREARAAAKVAKSEVEKEFGPGWRVRVWENMGWYFCVKKWPISVRKDIGSPGEDTTWWAQISPSGESGLMMWQPGSESYYEPRSAITAAVRAAQECLNDLIAVVGTAMSDIGEGVEE